MEKDKEERENSDGRKQGLYQSDKRFSLQDNKDTKLVTFF